jgi:catechol 2,3-dioxygenase-like lactoylglutathione lyase family enzyme
MAKIRHIAIQVPDLEKAAAFYEGVFELKRVKKVEASCSTFPNTAGSSRRGNRCSTSNVGHEHRRSADLAHVRW